MVLEIGNPTPPILRRDRGNWGNATGGLSRKTGEALEFCGDLIEVREARKPDGNRAGFWQSRSFLDEAESCFFAQNLVI